MKSLLDMTEPNWNAFLKEAKTIVIEQQLALLCVLNMQGFIKTGKFIYYHSFFFKKKSYFEDTNQEAIWFVQEPNINGTAISPTKALLSLMPSCTPVQRKPRRCFTMLHFICALGWSKRPPRHSETLPALCIMSDGQWCCQLQIQSQNPILFPCNKQITSPLKF